MSFGDTGQVFVFLEILSLRNPDSGFCSFLPSCRTKDRLGFQLNSQKVSSFEFCNLITVYNNFRESSGCPMTKISLQGNSLRPSVCLFLCLQRSESEAELGPGLS